MFDDKKLAEQKSQKIEVFNDETKAKIHQTMLLDELPNPTNLKNIGYDGKPTDEPLKDNVLNVQMYWKDQNKNVGLLIAIPSFIYLVLLIGLNNNIFDGVVGAIGFVVRTFLGFLPGI